MKTFVANDRAELGRFVASKAAEVLRATLQAKETCHLVIATGSSQFEVLDTLVQEPNIDWSRVHGFHLDEYLGIDREHSASFCGYLKKRFVDRVPLGSFFYLDGDRPAEDLVLGASQAISEKEIDLLLCGIGENGHLAFNDPPADLTSEDPYLIVDLDEQCRKQQVGEGWFDSFEQVPTQAISMSIRQILKAKCILCAVPDRRKAAAVKATLEGEVTAEVPASVLREHGNTSLILDAASASLLESQDAEPCEPQSA
ncbi:MAG: glucosamine-6-phosphate deaminase [Pirellulaceae bacterium]